MNSRLERYFDAKEIWKLIEFAGLATDLLAVDLWERAQSPVDSGRLAERAARRLANILERRLGSLDAMQSQPVAELVVPPGKAVVIGYRWCDPVDGSYHDPLLIDMDVLDEHAAVCGPTGSGKTTYFRFLGGQLVKKYVSLDWVDPKGEGRSIPGAMVFRADQYPWNMLEPVGNSQVYYSSFSAEFANSFALRTETWPELVRLLLGIERGLKPGDPHPSLKDFERLLFVLGEREGNPKFLTAASAFASLNAVLGPTAYVRKAPDISNRYPIIVHDYEGLPSHLCSFLNAIHLFRAQVKASVRGRA